MSRKYKNLLSPYKIGNVVFKNRMTASMSRPHFIQGPELYPTDALITHYANKAKNGAAFVTVSGIEPAAQYFPQNLSTMYGLNAKPLEPPTMGKDAAAPFRTGPALPHSVAFDPGDFNVQHYLCQLVEAIQFYGSKASAGIMSRIPPEYDVSSGISHPGTFGDGSPTRVGKEIPAELLEEIADDFAMQAALMKDLGFDMVFLHMSYRGTLMGRCLSPLTNKRTDKYGGSLENRARFPLLIADRIKKRCGPDFLIEASISGCENYPGGLSLEDTVEYAKMFEGYIDLLQVRAGDIDPAHPTGFMPERTPYLYMAEAIKKSGAKIGIVTIGGYTYLEDCEEAIASGAADFVGMARSWISNPDFGQMAYEGRGEDVIPCVRCNKCHKSSYADPWTSVCSVNPIWGIEHKVERMVVPPVRAQRIAVIGGGPAGMKAALVASERDHEVTIYEKSDALGGLLKTSDDVSFKWPVKDFKDYLVRQVEKSNTKVLMNTEANPEIIEKEKYNVVLAAVGSEPIIPSIPGIDQDNVFYAHEVYSKIDSLKDNVVVIGGGEVGVETAMHIVEKGRNVTVLEMCDILAPESTPVHYYSMFKEAWENLENFKFILQATCNKIGKNSVTYVDENGKENTIEAGSVVIAVGMKSKNDQALKFSHLGDKFYMIGDCNKAGNIQKAMRGAFSIASII